MRLHVKSINDLTELVESVGFQVSRFDDRDDLKQVSTREGAVLNWFPSTGRLSFQGEGSSKIRLEASVRKYLQDRGEIPLTF